MRSRILPCDCEMAFAQICGTLRSTRLAVISTLASMEEPTATTPMEKSSAPIWRSVSMERASAWTVWVTRSAHFCTSPASVSMARTSRPRRSSWPAVAAPNRPRPITRTGALCLIRSTNERPLLRVLVQLLALALGERRGECHCTNAPAEHRGRHHVHPRIRQLLRQAGRQAARGERGDHVEQHV